MLSELYRSMAESSADGLWVVDGEGRTVFANARTADMLRLPRTELSRRRVSDFLDDEGIAQWRRHLDRLDADPPGALPVDCRFVRADGTAAWYLVTETRLEEDGVPAGLLLSLSEFDDRRRLEAELAESREQLLRSQRIARMGSWSWDLRRDEVTLSTTVHELFGLGGGPSTRTWRESMTRLDPVARDTVRAANAPILAGESDTSTYDLQLEIPGAPGWIRVQAVAERDDEGTLRCLSGTLQDVTETLRAETALRDLARDQELLRRIAAAANGSESLEEALASTASLVLEAGWSRARAFVPAPTGDRLVDLGAPLDSDDGNLRDPTLPAREVATAEAAAAAGGPVWDSEAHLVLACPVLLGERVVAVILSAGPEPTTRHDDVAAMIQLIATQLATVAEREAAARELGAARDAAMEASRLKSEFLATMSHEIRTPLNGVIGLNELLGSTDLDAHQQRLVAGVGASGRALLGLVDDVLDFSKIEAGRLVLEDLDLDVRGVLDDVAAMTVEAAGARGVELVMHVDRDVPEVVRGDRVRLTQVVSNLVSNAVKFTEHGDVVVRAQVGDDERPDRDVDCCLLRVEVSDSGVGISPERLGGIFDPFIQADASTTRRFGGTGLGLAIVKEIVSALDGEVGLSSELGVGSVFWFTARLRCPPTGDRAAGPLAGRRVLLADDHPARRAALAELLAAWGASSTDADGVEHDGGAEVALVGSATAPAGSGLVPVVQLLPPGTVPLDGHHALERPVPGPVLLDALLAALGDETVDPSTRTAASATSGAVPDAPLASAARGRRVLVVEDTPVNQMVAEGVLAALGYEATSVDDGVLALEHLYAGGAGGAGGVDLVLMDVQMPRLDGYATAREIRRRERETGTPRIPIVAMTAAAVTGERERCLSAGMDDFLTKPVSPARLAAVLAQHLARHPADAAAAPESPAEPLEPAEPAQASGADRLDLERLEMLRDLDPGNTDYLDRVIGNFVSRTPELARTLRTAVEGGDAASVTATAHRLRGSALNLGVPGVAEAALRLELLGEAGDLTGAGDLLSELDDRVAEGREDVVRYQASYTVPGTVGG